jgi:hypothetical protein
LSADVATDQVLIEADNLATIRTLATGSTCAAVPCIATSSAIGRVFAPAAAATVATTAPGPTGPTPTTIAALATKVGDPDIPDDIPHAYGHAICFGGVASANAKASVRSTTAGTSGPCSIVTIPVTDCVATL